jgi:hypothetical protein
VLNLLFRRVGFGDDNHDKGGETSGRLGRGNGFLPPFSSLYSAAIDTFARICSDARREIRPRFSASRLQPVRV